MSTAIAQRRGHKAKADMADDEDPVLTLLQNIIESNGQTSRPEKDQALFVVLKAIYKTLKPMETRLETLEQKSIVLWIEKHPRQAAFVLGLAILLANAWFVSDFRKPILALFGLPTDLLP